MDTEKASNFINSLVRNLQVLCHSNVDFSEDVEVIGHIYLSVDKSKKFNYIVNEKVCKNDNSSTVFVSNSFHADQEKKKEAEPKNVGNQDPHQRHDERDYKPKRQSFSSNYRDTHFQHHSPSKRPPAHFSHTDGGIPHQKHRRISSHQQDNRVNDPASFRDTVNVKLEASASSTETFSAHNPSFSSSAVSASQSKNPSIDPRESVDIDLTNIKDEPDDDNSCLFTPNSAWNQEQQMLHQQTYNNSNKQRTGSSDGFRDSNEEMFGIYPVAMHQLNQQEANLEALSQMSSHNPSTSNEGSEQPNMSMIPSGADGMSMVYNPTSPCGVTCPICGYRLAQKRSLAQHIREKHSNIRHKCDYCDASFSRQITKKNHMLKFHAAVSLGSDQD